MQTMKKNELRHAETATTKTEAIQIEIDSDQREISVNTEL